MIINKIPGGGGTSKQDYRTNGVRRIVALLDETKRSCALFCRRGQICECQFFRGSGNSFECHEMQKINLGDFVNFWMRQKTVRYYVVADRFVNVNHAEDLASAQQSIGFG